MTKYNIQNLTITALMSAIICIMGPVVIPIGMVPMSFVNLAIYLTVLLMDKKKAVLSVGIYLLIGFVGLPVFAGFTGGAGKIFGPTGGYLLGYLFLSWISGSILEKWDEIKTTGRLQQKEQDNIHNDKETKRKKDRKRILKQFFALIAGTICLYVIGTIWLMLQSKLEIFSALSVGVFPFVGFDIIKIMVALMLSESIKKRIGNYSDFFAI